MHKRRAEDGTSRKEGNEMRVAWREKIKSDKMINKSRQEDSELNDNYQEV